MPYSPNEPTFHTKYSRISSFKDFDENIEKEKEEILIIEKFLPKQLDEGELIEIIKSIVKETGATSQADMGKVMGMANKQLGGKADGKTIAAIVKDILASNNF